MATKLSTLLLQCFYFQLACSHSMVKFLPGFQGPLPFELETGYVGVRESENAQLFYYFVKSEGNPEGDPLLLWLTGGPGCSAFSALAYEIGPVNFNIVEYNGTLPTLVLNPHSWTKISNILFVDSPVGTGFSYSRIPLSSQVDDFKQIRDIIQFFKKWLMDHTEFLSNPVYIGGDSYSGVIVPAVMDEISKGKEDIESLINLQGYILGNPQTDQNFDENSKIPFAHGMGLISDELYESLKRSCGGQYINIPPGNVDCLRHMDEYSKCISGIKPAHILESKCALVTPKGHEMSAKRRSLHQQHSHELQPSLPRFGCPTYKYLLAYYWMNDRNVREALRIREGSIEKWERCIDKSTYNKEITSSLGYHVNLSTRGYRSLIYSGDHDMLFPFLGTQAWIRNLNYSIVHDWRPWILHDQVAGYARTYSNQMTFATVKGAGHVVLEYKPAEAYAMFKRWILHDPL